MNTHLRHLIQELRSEDWEYVPTQTNGAPHFVHPRLGKVAIASTPADWEDECNYTRQRIRKATRRHQDLPIALPQKDPLDQAFSEIDSLQHDLNLLKEEGPKLLALLREKLIPIYEGMVEERRRMVAALGDSLCETRWKRSQKSRMEELCLVIADTTRDRLQQDLSSEFPFLEVIRKSRTASLDNEDADEDSEDSFKNFDIDAWEEWFAMQESNTTYHPEKRKPLPKKTPEQKMKHSEIQNIHRKLYLGLARELHPDKTVFVEEQIRRTHLMKQLNAAYSKGDIKSLLSIRHLHGSDRQRDSMDEETQSILLQSLENQRKELREEIRLAVSEMPEIDGDWITILSSEKQKEFFIRKEKRQAEAECQRLKEILREIQSPQGLLHLLRETNMEDWLRIF